MTAFWDDPDLQGGDPSDTYIKWEQIGDEYKGTIAKLGKRYFEGQEKPAVEITFADSRIMTVGQWMLRRSLLLLAPGVGDTLWVQYIADDKRGSKASKMFKGEVTRFNGTVDAFDHTKNTTSF